MPYLAWTGIYLVFTLITVTPRGTKRGRSFATPCLLGYSQMYFVVVIFQFYLLFPLLLRLLRKTRHHGSVMAASLVSRACHSACSSATTPSSLPASNVTHAINSVLPISRDFLTYQEFFIAGMLVALHLDRGTATSSPGATGRS